MPVGRFKLFWRFVFFVRPTDVRLTDLKTPSSWGRLPLSGTIQFLLGRRSKPIAYREDALWFYQEDKENWVLIDRQRIDFEVTVQGGVKYRDDYAEFNNGHLIARAKRANAITEFLVPYHNASTYDLNGEEYEIRQDGSSLCIDPERGCESDDGIFIEAEVAIEPQPSYAEDLDTHILPIFWMTNRLDEDDISQSYSIFEIVQQDVRGLASTIGGRPYIPGISQGCPDHNRPVSFDPGIATHWRQRDAAKVKGFYRLQLTEIKRCFQMTVDSIPLAAFENKNLQPEPRPRHTFLTNPDLFYIGAYKNTQETIQLQKGRIRRIVFDPTNPCWSCPTGV